jgi:site-specific DNA-adenine methylase
MVQERQIINRVGNKRNDIKYFKMYFPENVKQIVEPFGGSFAVSSYLLSNNPSLKVHINDVDDNLFYVYKNYKEYEQYKTDYVKYSKDNNINRNSKYDEKKEGIDNFLNNYFKDKNEKLKNYCVQFVKLRGMYKIMHNKANILKSDVEILNNHKVTNKDYMKVINKYNDEDTFIFFDPPYIFSNNSAYDTQKGESDNSDMIVYLLSYMLNTKCKCMLIVNDLKLIRILCDMYEQKIINTYQRIYQMSKKEEKHLIIINYDIAA